MNLQEAYAPERLGRPWGFKSSDYAGGYHRGLDVRKQNAGRTASIVTDVIAIHSGTVTYVGRPNKSLELTIVIDRGEGVKGRYESHSHSADASVKVGDRVEGGDRLARNARMNERPGQIRGVHDHVVISDWVDGAWNTRRATYDPMPFIEAALAAPAAAPASGAPITIPTFRRKIMYVLGKPGGDYFMVGQKRIHHLGSMDDLRAAEAVFGPRVNCNDRQFRVALVGLRVPYSLAAKGADWAG